MTAGPRRSAFHSSRAGALTLISVPTALRCAPFSTPAKTRRVKCATAFGDWSRSSVPPKSPSDVRTTNAVGLVALAVRSASSTVAGLANSGSLRPKNIEAIES